VKPGVAKPENQSHLLVFINYINDTKGYRLLDPATSKVIVSRDIISNDVVS
jgi:hypothetical protein